MAAGTINYVTSSEANSTSDGESRLIWAETQYFYEMKVCKDVIPTPHDMEASNISPCSGNGVKKALDDGEFAPGNTCIILDFFIRHGLVTFENEPRYNEIIKRLHRPLETQTASSPYYK